MTKLLFREDAYAKTATARVLAVSDAGIEFDRTIFYPMGGGQLGDSGRLRLADGREIAILDTRKGEGPDQVLHLVAPGSPLPETGAEVVLEIDWERRHRLMRMHTVLHLLSAVLVYPVTGGQVGDGKGRLDFDCAGEVPDKSEVGARLARLIGEDHAVSARWIRDEELGAQPELVKTLSVKPPMGQGQVRLVEIAGLDVQACGGTHVARTGEIGAIIVRKIESKGRKNRRVVLELA